MALQFSYTSPSDIVVPAAYAHITSFGGTKTGMQLQLTIYKDASAKNANKQPVGTYQAKLEIANGATMAQLYTALKVLPIFADATDV